MSESIFKAQNLHNDLEEKGFAILPFLLENEIAELREFYYSLAPEFQTSNGFQVTLDPNDKEAVSEVSQSIVQKIEAAAQRHFKNFQIFTGSFVVKGMGRDTLVPPHQDWTFTDEEHYTSMTVWIPLMDVDEKNGALGVIPGSHRLFNRPRSSPSPQSKSPLADHFPDLLPYVHVKKMKAGEALIFNHALIHASPPNLSSQPRLGVGIGIVNAQAPLWHFFLHPDKSKLLKLGIETSFLNQYNNQRLSDLFEGGKTPDIGTVLMEIPYVDPSISQKEIQDLLTGIGSKGNWPGTNDLTEVESAETPIPVEETVEEDWKDPRSFFEMYSLPNIIAELKWRFQGRP